MFNKFRLVLIAIAVISIFVGVSMSTNKLKSFQSNVQTDKAQVISESNATTATVSPTFSKELSVKKTVPTITKNSVRTGKVRLGIVVDDYANKSGTIPGLEQRLGVKFSTVSVYKQFGHPTNNSLNLSDLSYVKDSSKTLMIAWEPWNPLEGGNQSKDYLKEIVNGTEDGYITEFANSIKAYGGKVILRFGHEMNGNWYPWAGKPDDYKKAYIRIVEIFRSNNVKNVSFNWSVNSENVPLTSFSQVSKYYPGSSYVDSIGIDGFNWGNTRGTGWKSFSLIFSNPTTYLSKTYNKPIIITEFASTENGGNKAEWINLMFKDLNTNLLSVNEIIWFNLNKETDWRIESSEQSLSAFGSSY